MINNYIKEAYKVLDGKPITEELAVNLSALKGSDILDLLSLANKVKERFSPKFHTCSITSIKSGKCSEDCSYCAQSAHYSTAINSFSLQSKETILEQAKVAMENGIEYFGLVSSGKGYLGDDKELESILATVSALKSALPGLKVCLAIGCLDRVAAKMVSEVGVYHYNHNLQVNPDKYSSIVSKTHHINERIDTIKYLREYGVGVCSGGIFGLGENAIDRVKLAFALKKLDVSTIPINILVPIKGTPAFNQKELDISEALKSTAIFRLIHPNKIIKLAAGRESVVKDFQGQFLLSGINGFLTGGYLTTRGRSVEEDKGLLSRIETFSR